VDADSLNIAIAFAAGALSFLSPCVVPLVPAYLTYITGLSADEVGDARASEVLPSALAFVAGLSLVLSLFGLGVTAIGQALSDYQTFLTRLGGAIVIVLGLHTAGLLRIPTLYRERRVDFLRFRGRGPAGAFLMGGAFGIGWTPCVGAILGSILTLASQSDTLGRGTLLLLAYSLGLGVPFILVALGIKRAFGLLGAIKRHLRTVELASGTLLVATGVLLFTDRLLLLTGWITRVFGNGLAL
jgi:cytochrome c-type biogenesis protein